MKIKCPECGTSYDIKAEALGAEGRSVKCARCSNRWFVSPNDPPVEDTEPKPSVQDASSADETAWEKDNAAEQSASDDGFEDTANDGAFNEAANTDADEAAFDADDEEEGDGQDIEASAHRPKIKVNPDKFKKQSFARTRRVLAAINFGRVGSVSVLVGCIVLCALVFVMRGSVVKQAPDLASLFEMIGMDINLRGLEFGDLRTFSDQEGGKPVLVVEGTIRNLLSERNQLPAIRLSIRGTDLQEIYAWTVDPRTRALDPLDQTRFRTILSDPPPGAADIQVRFIDRDKRQLALE